MAISRKAQSRESRSRLARRTSRWSSSGCIQARFPSQLQQLRKARKLKTFLELLVLADQIVCLGHSIGSLHRRKLSLSAITNTSLLSMSVQPLLPRSHPTRKLFAQSWLGPCLSYIHPGEGYTRSLLSSVQKEFRFEKDLKESVECALDLA